MGARGAGPTGPRGRVAHATPRCAAGRDPAALTPTQRLNLHTLADTALGLMQPSAALQESTLAFFHTRLLGLPAALASFLCLARSTVSAPRVELRKRPATN